VIPLAFVLIDCIDVYMHLCCTYRHSEFNCCCRQICIVIHVHEGLAKSCWEYDKVHCLSQWIYFVAAIIFINYATDQFVYNTLHMTYCKKVVYMPLCCPCSAEIVCIGIHWDTSSFTTVLLLNKTSLQSPDFCLNGYNTVLKAVSSFRL